MDRQDVPRATFLIMAIFVLQPLTIGGWLALIPVIKSDLGLSKGALALCLLGMPLGLIPSLNVAGRVLGRFGTRRILRVAMPALALAMLLPVIAGSGTALFFALMIAGASAGFSEVAMNLYAGQLEKRADVLVMNRCHGFWAAGLMIGSAASLLALTPLQTMTCLTVLSGAGGIAVAQAMPRLGIDETTAAPPRRRPRDLPRALIMIGGFMLLVTLTEGVMADWSAVYMAERMNDPYGNAGIAVTVFSAFMAGGRFLGDWLKRRLGAVALAASTTLAAIFGLVLVVLPLPNWVMLPGFAFVGFGVATAYPLGVSAIAALDDRHESANIAIMATVALGSFLIGPPLIGILSEAFSLRLALAALLPGLCVALWLTRWLRPDSGPDSGQ